MSLRLVNAGGRAALVCGDSLIDVEQRSNGRFTANPMDALRNWSDFEAWASDIDAVGSEPTLDEAKLGPCVPGPQKVFGIGLNYRDHAQEAGLEIPKQPMVFTKFPSCLAGPRSDVVLTSNRVDYEAELVVVVGRRGRDISEAKAFDHLAGYCVGQDISDRRQQFADRPPQFSLGKSYDGFGPIGPALVGRGDVPDPDALAIRCEISGETLQDGTTADMIFPVAELVSFLSRSLTLEPGDLIFTGTPSGVGSVREPRRYLAAGDVITTEIERLGSLVNRCRET